MEDPIPMPISNVEAKKDTDPENVERDSDGQVEKGDDDAQDDDKEQEKSAIERLQDIHIGEEIAHNITTTCIDLATEAIEKKRFERVVGPMAVGWAVRAIQKTALCAAPKDEGKVYLYLSVYIYIYKKRKREREREREREKDT